MKEMEIRELIKRHGLYVETNTTIVGNKIKTEETGRMGIRYPFDKDGEFFASIKQEAMDLMREDARKKREADEARWAAINSIEGLSEIESAMEDLSRWRDEFDASFWKNDCVGLRAKPKYDIKAMRKEHPRADAYLKTDEMIRKFDYCSEVCDAALKAREEVIFGDYRKAMNDLKATLTAISEESPIRWDFDANFGRFMIDEDSETVEEAVEETATEEETAEVSLTVKPERHNFDGVAVIAVDEENRVIRAEYCKDEVFRSIVKSLGYRWRDFVWKKSLNDLDSLTDREGELGNRLLADGFAVRFATVDGMKKAISGEFSDEVKRWVYLIDDQFKLYWEYGNDRMYKEARSLRSAKWDSGKGRMSVKRSAFAEVEDFAEINGFVLSEKAKQAIKEERAKLDGATVVSVKRKESKSDESDKLQEILESSREVIADLVDED